MESSMIKYGMSPVLSLGADTKLMGAADTVLSFRHLMYGTPESDNHETVPPMLSARAMTYACSLLRDLDNPTLSPSALTAIMLITTEHPALTRANYHIDQVKALHHLHDLLDKTLLKRSVLLEMMKNIGLVRNRVVGVNNNSTYEDIKKLYISKLSNDDHPFAFAVNFILAKFPSFKTAFEIKNDKPYAAYNNFIEATYNVSDLYKGLTDDEFIHLLELMSLADLPAVRRMYMIALTIGTIAIVKGPSPSRTWYSKRLREYFEVLPEDERDITLGVEEVGKFHRSYIQSTNNTTFPKRFILTLANLPMAIKIERMSYDLEQSRGQNSASLEAVSTVLTQYPILTYSFLRDVMKYDSELTVAGNAMLAIINDPYSTLCRPKYPVSDYKKLAAFCVTIRYRGNLMNNGIIMSQDKTFTHKSQVPLRELEEIVQSANVILEMMESAGKGAITLDTFLNYHKFKSYQIGNKKYICTEQELVHQYEDSKKAPIYVEPIIDSHSITVVEKDRLMQLARDEHAKSMKIWNDEQGGGWPTTEREAKNHAAFIELNLSSLEERINKTVDDTAYSNICSKFLLAISQSQIKKLATDTEITNENINKALAGESIQIPNADITILKLTKPTLDAETSNIEKYYQVAKESNKDKEYQRARSTFLGAVNQAPPDA